MKAKIIVFIGIIILIVALFYGLKTYEKWPSQTPEKAIKKYAFFNGKNEVSELIIRPTNYEDPHYGWGYHVQGFYADPGNVEVRYFYLKKNNRGWYVYSAGTGP